METVRKLSSVVGLYAGDGEREEVHHLFEELDGVVAAKLLEDHLKLQAAVFVDSGVLIELLPCQSPREAFLGHILHIHLNALTAAFHTFIGFWKTPFFLRLCGLIHALPAQSAEQCTPGTCITVLLYEVDVKHIQTHLLVLACNSQHKQIFVGCMLSWVVMGTAATFGERGNGSIIAFHPPPYAFAADVV